MDFPELELYWGVIGAACTSLSTPPSLFFHAQAPSSVSGPMLCNNLDSCTKHLILAQVWGSARSLSRCWNLVVTAAEASSALTRLPMGFKLAWCAKWFWCVQQDFASVTDPISAWLESPRAREFHGLFMAMWKYNLVIWNHLLSHGNGEECYFQNTVVLIFRYFGSFGYKVTHPSCVTFVATMYL